MAYNGFRLRRKVVHLKEDEGGKEEKSEERGRAREEGLGATVGSGGDTHGFTAAAVAVVEEEKRMVMGSIVGILWVGFMGFLFG